MSVIDDVIIQYYNDLKSNKYRYILLKRNADNSEIILGEFADNSASFNDFIISLPKNECRYCVYNFDYNNSGVIIQKIILILWAPDSAHIRDKMYTASSKDSVKKILQGISFEIAATDEMELDYDCILDKFKSIYL